MPRIDMLTLANHAEAVNGLLYLSGAGWDAVTRHFAQGSAPQPQHLGIGAMVIVDYHETQQPWMVKLWIEDEDATNRLMEIEAKLEVTRAGDRPPGAPTRAVIAINANVGFPGPGGYRLAGEVDGDLRTYSFRVVDVHA